ncbi:ABC transporter, ATP-binding protein [Citrifermentans bemidjiense Bem]|uniref:ABC transporter, ATP-binding protein n=1 Tax=Citrifermentans bemidjiense (strain ATCC BAA-1014 / DSM 16622 / JCM 12645 / Bem) TaxID=404380 RepID=B5EE77_CITBB|nr:ABC transporter ATP-binding protein [Citrifermentans bemidjiense]ACH39222.1 ABC transporter, ATP-binding protein [Citrifermentans bemidjiense Bem]
MADPIIELTGICKSFQEGERERVVFRNASLAVETGEWLFLLGRSGSGKSTLLNLLSGIDLPDSGEVRVAGQPLNRQSERERTLFRRSSIGFVFQFYNLIPTLTVLENVLLPLELAGLLNPEHDKLARDLLEQVGLADRAASFPDRLSGGEQQRVAVARALVHRPKLVLADEPTGNLDAETGRQVLDLFQRLLRESGTTLVLVTHSAEVAALADRVLTIENGLLVEAGRRSGGKP